MALNQQKLISIILEEAGKLPERCEGYREEMFDTMCDVITLERQHRREGRYIKQEIADKCNALGRFLSDNRKD